MKFLTTERMQGAFFCCLLFATVHQGVCFNSILRPKFKGREFHAPETKDAKLERTQEKLAENLQDVNTSVVKLLQKVHELENKTSHTIDLNPIKASQDKTRKMVEDISAKYEALEQKSKEAAAVKKYLEALKAGQEKYSKEIKSLDKKVSTVSAELKQDIEKNIQAVNTSLLDLSSKNTELEEKLSKGEQKLNKMEKKDEAVRMSLSGLSSKNNQIEEKLEKLEEKLKRKDEVSPSRSKNWGNKEMEKTVEVVKTSLSDLSSKNTLLEEKMKKMEEKLNRKDEEKSSRSETQGTKEMEKEMEGVRNSLLNLAAKNTELEAKIKNMEKTSNRNVEEAPAKSRSYKTEVKVSSSRRHGVKKPTSCAEVKKCGTTEEDGEFWLYPEVLGGKRVKIFCSGMRGHPKEYVTLYKPNVGDFPAVTNEYCRRETKSNHPRKEKIGHIKYNKIRVDIKTMKILPHDTTFTESTGSPIPYGQASDCYTKKSSSSSSSFFSSRGFFNGLLGTSSRSPSRCLPKGFFNIDTRRTGLRVSTNVTWKKVGYYTSISYKRLSEGQVIHVRCGGYCGGCVPSKYFTLERLSLDGIRSSAAQKVTCPE